jgi:hypothetical protein
MWKLVGFLPVPLVSGGNNIGRYSSWTGSMMSTLCVAKKLNKWEIFKDFDVKA